MKKLISVLLALVLGLVSFSVVAFAEVPAPVMAKITFKLDGGQIGHSTEDCVLDTEVGKQPAIPANPTKAEGKNDKGEPVKYTFKGWQLEGDKSGKLYWAAELPEVTGDVTYVAVYLEAPVVEEVTFFNFIQTIFDRISEIFAQIWAYLSFLPGVEASI